MDGFTDERMGSWIKMEGWIISWVNDGLSVSTQISFRKYSTDSIETLQRHPQFNISGK
jgi:hypothetical protein